MKPSLPFLCIPSLPIVSLRSAALPTLDMRKTRCGKNVWAFSWQNLEPGWTHPGQGCWPLKVVSGQRIPVCFTPPSVRATWPRVQTSFS